MAKFTSIQEAVTAFNSGAKIKATQGVGMWKKGDIIRINPGSAYMNGTYINVLTNAGAYNLTLSNIEKGTATVADMKEAIESYKKIINELEGKIKFVKATGAEEFDETEFKVWNTLQLLKGKMTDLEKAKEIAKLINN